MDVRIFALALFALVALASPAHAEESRPLLRQILIMWFPLALIVGLWIFFIRQTYSSQYARMQREVIARSPAHMDALEKKLDRIIELLEQRENR